MIVWLLACVLTADAASVGDNSPAMYDTIVVGMGASGTTAATTLARAGRKVLGLEAQNRIGGRVKTVPFGDGVVEVGAEWIHGSHPSRVYDLAVAHNVSLLSQDLSMEAYRSDGSKTDNDIINELTNYALQVVEDPPDEPQPLGEFITGKLMDYIKDKHPSLLEDQDFITEYLAFLDLVVDNYEATTSWNDITTDSKYEELEGDQHMSWHRNGYKTLFEILLNTYNNGSGLPNLEYKLNKEVTQIEWPQEPSGKVVVTCKDGATYTANNVIVTVSVGVLKERQSDLFSPSLPQHKISAIENLPMGLLGKIILLFPLKWWKSDCNFYGFIWRTQDRSEFMEDLWATKLEVASSPMGSSHALTMWTSGDTGRLLEIMYSTLSVTQIKDELRKRKASLEGKKADLIERLETYDRNYNFGAIEEDYLDNDKYDHPSAETFKDINASTALPPLSKHNIKEFIERYLSLFSPPLPKPKVDAIQNIRIGVEGKIIFLFPDQWWGQTQFFEFIWRGSDKIEVQDRWLTRIAEASHPMGANSVLSLWISGDYEISVETLPDDVVKRKCMELIRRFMGANVTVPEPIDMIRSNWHSNPYTRGSYTYDHISSPLHPTARSDLAEPLTDSSGKPRVLFAGEATNPTHFSTVHGAVDTGHREAMRLLPSSKI